MPRAILVHASSTEALAGRALAGPQLALELGNGALPHALTQTVPAHAAGASVLELGSGTGLVGMCAMRAGAAWVALTDGGCTWRG